MADQAAAAIAYLERGDCIRVVVLREIMEALDLQPGTRLLDLGCGIGLQALQLVEVSGPGSRIVGVDISQEMLVSAAGRVASSTAGNQVALAAGDMRSLPFPEDVFDLCWSTDCLGYPAADQLPLLSEVARVAKPGATLAILAWTSQSVLPGYGLLEARLNATASAFASHLSQFSPEQAFMRLGGSFPAAGIREMRCRTFLGNVTGPLDEQQRRALTDLFEMLWRDGLAGASPADQQAFAHLCEPDSPDCLLNLPDYHAFFTYTLFSGRVQK